MTPGDPRAALAAALADRYRIERELGQGGMATVYLADDLRHHRKVAIKVLHPELAAAIGAERFLAEIRTTAALQHPQILPLFDSGSADDGRYLFYVMPYVEGESLRARLDREKQLPLDDALRIAGEVAAALDYAHRHGVVHRDIKPDNIMFSSGQAVVADFGIARAIGAAGGEQLTQTGMAIGTPAYMSPEQSAGESDVDGRSDVYSLATVLYEMLAGEPPFTGPTAAAIIAKRLGGPTPDVRVVRDGVSEPVDRALRKALQRTPADRFGSAAEFADALRAAAAPRRAVSGRAMRAIAGVLALVLAGAGWWMARGDGLGNDLNEGVIAVLPFRVGGGPGIAYLRESMLDLLDARLTGEPGPRTVPPRTTLSAWRQSGGADGVDLSEDESRDLAARLGAGRVLLGSAVATPTEVTLSGTLLRVSDGQTLASESVAGMPDSIAVLVNRLTARLLSLGAGEGRERLDGLAETSLEALQDYLAGQQAYRSGDFFAAMDHYARAFARDSNFVQAAFGLVTTNPWIGTLYRVDGMLAIPKVWRLRDRLSARDLALFRAMQLVGPNYPGPSTFAEIIAQAEVAAAGAPDSPEHWLQLGNSLGAGAAASIPQWRTRMIAALDRAIALDSSFTPAVQARVFDATWVRDTAALRSLAPLLERAVRRGHTDATMSWAIAVTLGDSAAARHWRGQGDDSSGINYFQKLIKIALHSAQVGIPLADARWANEALRREGRTAEERKLAFLGELAVAFAEGRLVTFDDTLDGAAAWNTYNLVQQAVVEPAYRSQATALIARNSPKMDRVSLGASALAWPPIRDCIVELFRVTGGDTTETAQSIGRLRTFAAADPPPIPVEFWGPSEFGVCPRLLEALLEAHRGPSGPALEALDEYMRPGPRWLTFAAPTAPTVAANWTVARLREAQGNIPAALAAIRRRESNYFPAYLWTLPAFLRQEGRLAALAGDTAGALAAYDQYLVTRTDPDPPFRAQRDSVVAERSALMAR